MGNYGSEQDDANAMLALLYADDELTVYPAAGGGPSTVPPNTLPPYVSVHFYTEHVNAGQRLDTRSTRTRTRAYAHCVGANDIAARAMASRVRAAWLDVRPDIPGRSVYPIRHEQSREPQTAEPAFTTPAFEAPAQEEHFEETVSDAPAPAFEPAPAYEPEPAFQATSHGGQDDRLAVVGRRGILLNQSCRRLPKSAIPSGIGGRRS